MTIYKSFVTGELKGKITFLALGIVCLLFLSLNVIAGILAVLLISLSSAIFIFWLFRVEKEKRDDIQRYLIRTGMFTWGWLLNISLVDDALEKPRKKETRKKLIKACLSSAVLYTLTLVGIIVFASFNVNKFIGHAFFIVLAPLSILLAIYSVVLMILVYKE